MQLSSCRFSGLALLQSPAFEQYKARLHDGMPTHASKLFLQQTFAGEDLGLESAQCQYTVVAMGDGEALLATSKPSPAESYLPDGVPKQLPNDYFQVTEGLSRRRVQAFTAKHQQLGLSFVSALDRGVKLTSAETAQVDGEFARQYYEREGQRRKIPCVKPFVLA